MEELNNMKTITPLLMVFFLTFLGCQCNQNKSGVEIQLTKSDSLGILAMGEIFKENIEKPIVIDNKNITIKRTEKEEKKNAELIEKVNKDINQGPYSKLSCQEILQLFIKDVFNKYKQTGDSKILANWPIDDAQIKGCMNSPEVKSSFDSLRLEIRKIGRSFKK